MALPAEDRLRAPQTPIEFRCVSKAYPLYSSSADRLKELLSFGRKTLHRTFAALTDVSFEVGRGETFCVIGRNGAGKSTLLQLVAGISQPTCGQVSIRGRVAALLELGAGFNPEFTGKQNVYLNASVYGLTRAETDARYEQIARFADIGSFLDQPVKTYSSGMVVRLAFAIAIHVEPDVLLVDEALAVGDAGFRQRCMSKIEALRRRGVTIVFVSHSMADVRAVGNRAMWLEHGRVMAIGEPATVVARYLAAAEGERSADESATVLRNVDHRHGDGRARILGIGLFTLRGEAVRMLEPCAPLVVRIEFEARQQIEHPVAGFVMRNHLGVEFAGTDTLAEGCAVEPLAQGQVRTVEFEVELPDIYPAHFSFSPFLADGGTGFDTMCDWVDNAITIEAARGTAPIYGYVHVPARVELNAPSATYEHRVHR